MEFEMPELGSSDDFVECRLYLDGELAGGGLGVHDRGGTHAEAALQARATQMMYFLQPWTRDYIWHRDDFVLAPHWAGASAEATDVRRVLYGRVYWGENIDDEWFVVWLLLQLTRRWPGVVAEVTDNDGQFLLIEAALEIPRWLKPANAAHRVFLSGGALHIVPLARDGGADGQITASEGVSLVCCERVATQAPSDTSEAVMRRLRSAGLDPSAGTSISACGGGGCDPAVHRARLWLPRAALRILAEEPWLVAAAVEAYVSRDPIDMRVCKHMVAFPPATRQHGLVKFTRCLYAQLEGQPCRAPPLAFGPLPPLPAPTTGAAEEAGKSSASSKVRLEAELGVKLACGFEILLQSGRRNLRRLHKATRRGERGGGGGGAGGEADGECDDDAHGWVAAGSPPPSGTTFDLFRHELARCGYGDGDGDDEQPAAPRAAVRGEGEHTGGSSARPAPMSPRGSRLGAHLLPEGESVAAAQAAQAAQAGRLVHLERRRQQQDGQAEGAAQGAVGGTGTGDGMMATGHGMPPQPPASGASAATAAEFASSYYVRMQEVKDTVADDSGGGGQSLAHSRSLRAAATMERILATLAAEDAAAEESAAGAAWQPIDGEADSDSWLQLTEAEVDAMLRGFGQQPAPGSPSPAPGGAASAAGAATERQPTPVEAEELLGLTQKMTAFLAQASGLEGVSDPATAEQRQETGKDESSAAATLAQHEAALAERRRHMEQLEEQERTGQGAAAAAEPSPLLGHQPVAWPSRTKARATAAAAAAAARQKAPEQAGHVEPDASEPESEPEPDSGGAAEAFSAAWLRASP
jgi:hypothetical protein